MATTEPAAAGFGGALAGPGLAVTGLWAGCRASWEAARDVLA